MFVLFVVPTTVFGISDDRMSQVVCDVRGNHLSNTTCLTHNFFKLDKSFCKLW